MYTSTERGGRAEQGSLMHVQRRGAGSMLLLLVVGIVMVVVCDGVVQRRCFRGLVSLIDPENVGTTSLTAMLPTYVCMLLKIYDASDHAFLLLQHARCSSCSGESQYHPLHVHALAAVGEVEVLLLLLSTETELAILALLRSHLVDLALAIIVREVLLNDGVGLHVDLLVAVVLALVDLLHATALLHEECEFVDGRLASALLSLLVHVTNLEDVLNTVKRNLNDLVVGAREELAQRLDGTLLDEQADLVGLLQATGGSVGDGPASLLTGLEVAVAEKVDKRGKKTVVNDGLDLNAVASSDVGDGPASLLTDTILSRAEQRQESGKSTAVDDELGLDIITGDNVADRTQSGCLDGGGGVHEQLYQATGDVGLDDSLDLVVGAIGQVRDSPAGVDENLVVKRVHELSENGERRSDGVPVRLRGLAAAEVAESPGGVPKHAELPAVTKKADKRCEGTLSENIVPAVRAVTSNVTKSPNGLLPDVRLGAAEQLNEDRHGAGLDDDLGLLC